MKEKEKSEKVGLKKHSENEGHVLRNLGKTTTTN